MLISLLLTGCGWRQLPESFTKPDIPAVEVPPLLPEDMEPLSPNSGEKGELEELPQPEEVVNRIFNDLLAPLFAPAGYGEITEGEGIVWVESPALEGWQEQVRELMDDQLANDFLQRTENVIKKMAGTWYVRGDAAEILNWDFTLDMESLTVLTQFETSLHFTAEGTARGGDILWRFYYYLQDGYLKIGQWFDIGYAPAGECDICIGGRWYGVFSTEKVSEHLGTPRNRTTELYTEQSISGEASYEETTLEYPGLTLTLHIEENGASWLDRFVLSQEPEAPNYATWRGISCGMSEEELLSAYPEFADEKGTVSQQSDGSLCYNPSLNFYGSNLNFFVENHIVTRIEGFFIPYD